MKRILFTMMALAAIISAVSCNKDKDKPLEQIAGEDGFIDLSKDGTANCYIVSAPGTYKFNCLIKGCGPALMERLGNSVEVLWESFGTDKQPKKGDIIKSVELNGYEILFQTPDKLADGNALIAYKYNDEILWSWHIWVCEDYDPVKTQQKYNDGSIVMDRNIGATSAESGSNATLGLYYQWGRKDPFVSSSSLYEPKFALSTKPMGVVPNTEGSVANSIKHPTDFYSSPNRTGESWMHNDDTLWGIEKTEYDPCPKGWKIPYAQYYTADMKFSGLWADAFGNDSCPLKFQTSSIDNGTINFGKTVPNLGKDQDIIYPFSGIIDSNGTVFFGLNGGMCWTCNYGRVVVYTSTNFRCTGAEDLIGLPVRCVKD